MDRRRLEGLVGRHAALPRAGVQAPAPRSPAAHDGGRDEFHFVTDGIRAALDRAREAARGKDIRLGGGVATVRQYLTAGLIDELHLVIAPVLLGRARTSSPASIR